MDMTASIIPKSDQINADDLMTGPITVTIASVSEGAAEQPIDMHLVETPGRAFRPSKSMRRVLVAAWGTDTDAYIGRRMTLYREPTVKFGKDEVGGVRISHLSHIDKQVKIALTVSRGRRDPFIVEPLIETTRSAPPGPAPKTLDERIEGMVATFAGQGVTVTDLERRIGAPREQWTAEDVDAMTPVFGQLKSGVSKDELFPREA